MSRMYVVLVLLSMACILLTIDRYRQRRKAEALWLKYADEMKKHRAAAANAQMLAAELKDARRRESEHLTPQGEPTRRPTRADGPTVELHRLKPPTPPTGLPHVPAARDDT